ncbi:MAG: DUF4469 domain-containing protein [Dysgonamonadaceae bacterium]|nr:DUF4469 domain-containing protein [Dysgonamonadaceae bacterium]
MAVRYVLEKNILSKDDEGDFIAQVVDRRTFTEKDIAEEIAGRNIGISKPEALAMLEALAEIVKDRLGEGYSVNTQLVHFHHTIPGVYREGEFPSEAVVRVTPSKQVAEKMKEVRLSHVEPSLRMGINHIDDVFSGTANDVITAGGSVKVFGFNIKIAAGEPADESVCVEFVAPDKTYRVPATGVVVNKPSQLIVVAPGSMVDGEKVTLRITTRYSSNGGKLLKAPRTVTFKKTLRVVNS